MSHSVEDHPFLELEGLWSGSWFRFLVITVAAATMAKVVTKVNLPVITGYMLVGVLCGPFILNLIPKAEVPELHPVTQVALAFIAFSAGSELYLPELRALFKRIIWISASLAVVTMILCTLIIFGIIKGGLVPFASPLTGSCQFAIAAIASSIMVSLSVVPP